MVGRRKAASSSRKKGRKEPPPGDSPAEELVGAEEGGDNVPTLVSGEGDGMEVLAALEAVEETPQVGLAGEGDGEILKDIDDEGPEQVLLVKGRDDALKQKRLENDAVKRVKRSMKEKRKLKAEMFKRQKEFKQLRVLGKFPEEALEKALSKIAERNAEKESEQPNSEDIEKEARSNSGSQPHRKGKATVTQIGSVKVIVSGGNTDMAGPGYTTERAQDFLRQHFYGGRLKRVSAGSQFPRKNRNKPAIDFVTTQR